ncbi:MAG: 16S rRNA (guanine(966)-N(2))-methyltransferase RsmD [Rhodospirillales bacterium 70-18]|nr:16S rRNA (guanine(966)-N(2))-methyltransferase RsmD [Rhodospirillales bacterium]OJY76320.1 MAG: 16S rRNA (guanine(966)-N(2))-methyltransferase RsmD [Rhodospirillales bacterium 70-18]
MRIVAGAWRGRSLAAPAGAATRPTADRMRQAVFDMLLHAPWAGREAIEGAAVLDAFAGTGALGLEALSRGAATAVFIERDRAALATLRANIAACRAEARCTVLAADATRPPPPHPPNLPCGLIFLDPPYGLALVPAALAALHAAAWLAPGALVVAETGRDEAVPAPDGVLRELLAERVHGAARVTFWRTAPPA